MKISEFSKMFEKISVIGGVLLLLFSSAAFASELGLVNPLTVANCTATTDESKLLMQCVQMANKINVSTELPPLNLQLNEMALVYRKLVVRLFEGLLLTDDFDVNSTNFEDLCKSFKAIDVCLTMSKMNCKSTFNETALTLVAGSIRGQVVSLGYGLRFSCLHGGSVNPPFKSILDKHSMKACLNAIPMKRKLDLIRIIRQIGNSYIDSKANLLNKDKSTREQKAICRKLDDANMMFKFAARCSSGQCADKDVGSFGSIVLTLLAPPNVCGCGKNVDEDESIKRTGRKDSNERFTVNFIGLSHIKNEKISKDFETCIFNSGEITLVSSENLVINATMVKKNNSSKEYSYMSKISIATFADEKNCGKAGDKPSKTLVFGEGISASKIDTKSKCGKRYVKVKSLSTNQSDSDRLQYNDECESVALIVRSQNTSNLGKVLYLTLRLSKSTEWTGELFSGCINQVDIPAANTSTSRRKKRSVASPFTSIGTYDYQRSGDKVLDTAAEATSEDNIDVEKLDSEEEEEGGEQTTTAPVVATVTTASAFVITASSTSFFIAMATILLNR